MSKFLNVQIPQACHQDWQTMSPDTKGRFCGSCSKTVVDFTLMSDTELVNFFKQTKTSTCGRFSTEQLNRDIIIPKKKIPWAKYFFQITLPAFLLTLKSFAQENKVKTPTEITSPIMLGMVKPVTKADTSKTEGITVTGTVKDENGIGIPYARVMIKGSKTGASTDSAGKFILKNIAASATLVISSVGFQTQEIGVNNKSNLDIELYLDYSVLGEVVVIHSTSSKRKDEKKIKEPVVKPKVIEPELSVYPNPLIFSSSLHLKWKGIEAGNYLIEVYSLSGSLMQTEKIFIEKGKEETTLLLKHLIAGNYFVRLLNEKNGKQLSEQFVIKE